MARKIRRRRRLVTVLTVLAVLAVVAFGTPTYFVTLSGFIWDYGGWHPAVAIMLLLFSLFIGMVAYALVSAPLDNSLGEECDPQKCLELNMAVLKPHKSNYHQNCMEAFLFLGDCKSASFYAQQIIATAKQEKVISGFFVKAVAEYLSGDFVTMKNSSQMFLSAVASASSGGVSAKARAAYEKMNSLLNLMLAIADGNKEQISTLCKAVEPWNKNKANEGLVNYMKGVGAYLTADKYECVYRLMWVKDIMAKTVFASRAEEYLKRLSLPESDCQQGV